MKTKLCVALAATLALAACQKEEGKENDAVKQNGANQAQPADQQQNRVEKVKEEVSEMKQEMKEEAEEVTREAEEAVKRHKDKPEAAEETKPADAESSNI